MWSKILQSGLLEKLATIDQQKQATDSQSPSLRALHEIVDYFKNKGDFELYSGVQGMKQLRFERLQHQKNREAEEAHARKHVWGSEDSGDDGEDMAEEFVNFGEININAPDIKPATQPPTPNQPQSTQPPPAPPPPPPESPLPPPGAPSMLRRALPWLLAAGATIAGGGAGAGLGYLLRDPPPVITPNGGGASFDVDVRPGEWRQPTNE